MQRHPKIPFVPIVRRDFHPCDARRPIRASEEISHFSFVSRRSSQPLSSTLRPFFFSLSLIYVFRMLFRRRLFFFLRVSVSGPFGLVAYLRSSDSFMHRGKPSWFQTAIFIAMGVLSYRCASCEKRCEIIREPARVRTSGPQHVERNVNESFTMESFHKRRFYSSAFWHLERILYFIEESIWISLELIGEKILISSLLLI